MAVDLEKIRKKHEEVKQKMKSKGGNFKDLVFGDNKQRFCSPSSPDKDFYKEAGYHYIKQGKETKAILCLRLTYGEECYLCDVVKALYDSKDKSDKVLASQMRAGMRIFYNIIDRDDENKHKVLVTGNNIFKDLLGFIGDEDWGDITHPKTGHDVTITKTKTGDNKIDVEYEVKPSPKLNEVTYTDEDLTDLDALVDRDYLTYEQQEAVFDGKDIPDEERITRNGRPATVSDKPAEKAETTQKPAPSRKPKSTSGPTEEEKRIMEKVVKVDLSIPKAVKAFDKWKAEDGSEAGLDKIIEFYGIEEETVKTETPAEQGVEEASGDPLQAQIDAALAKFKKKK